MFKVLKLAVHVVRSVFTGAMTSYEAGYGTSFPDAAKFCTMEYDDAVVICERLGIICGCLRWILTAACSVLGFTVPGVCEVRLAKKEFKFT